MLYTVVLMVDLNGFCDLRCLMPLRSKISTSPHKIFRYDKHYHYFLSAIKS